MSYGVLILGVVAILTIFGFFDKSFDISRVKKLLVIVGLLLSLPIAAFKIFGIYFTLSGFILPLCFLIFFIIKSIQEKQKLFLFISITFNFLITISIFWFLNINIYKLTYEVIIIAIIVTFFSTCGQKIYCCLASSTFTILSIDIFSYYKNYSIVLGSIQIFDALIVSWSLIIFGFALIELISKKQNNNLDISSYQNTKSNSNKFDFFN